MRKSDKAANERNTAWGLSGLAKAVRSPTQEGVLRIRNTKRSLRPKRPRVTHEGDSFLAATESKTGWKKVKPQIKIGHAGVDIAKRKVEPSFKTPVGRIKTTGGVRLKQEG